MEIWKQVVVDGDAKNWWPEFYVKPGFKNYLKKTSLCRNWQNGNCRFGSRCQFAHGMHDLRAPFLHPNYKTEPCYNYQKTGKCRYGDKCRYKHE